jgi:hypothetical protein
MKLNFSNIRDFKIMYITTSIGVIANIEGVNTDIISKGDPLPHIKFVPMHIYNILISRYGGVNHFRYKSGIHCNLIINELIYNNINTNNVQSKDNVLDTDEVMLGIKKIIKSNSCTITGLSFDIYTMKILAKEGQNATYYSLIFLAVPFALKINDKKILIKQIDKFVKIFTKDHEHILATITCGLFIHYAQNDININKWIEHVIKDLEDLDGIMEYSDYLNNYDELNFRNNKFINKKKEDVILERNNNFFNNFCSIKNSFFTQNPYEQVLLILDSLLRAEDNWEKLVLFGITNFNDNINISLILGILYEILFSSSKVNKNLIKRFSFN